LETVSVRDGESRKKREKDSKIEKMYQGPDAKGGKERKKVSFT